MKTRISPMAVAVLLSGLALQSCHNDDRPEFVPPNGNVFVLTSDSRLLSFFSNEPNVIRSAATLSGSGFDPAVDVPVGMDFRPASGSLYIVTRAAAGGAGKLFLVQSVLNGAVTKHCDLIADTADPYTGLTGAAFGVDFNPTLDRLRIVSDTGQNLSINPVKLDPPAPQPPDTVCEVTTQTALASGATGAAYTDHFDNACRTSLFYINGNQLFTTTDPSSGVQTAVGSPLGVTPDAVNGFDISVEGVNPPTNIARAVFSVAGVNGGAPALYSIDTATGAAVPVGPVPVNSGETIRGMSIPFLLPFIPSQAVGELTALNDDNQVLTFNRGSPARLCTAFNLSGIPSAETAIGLDYRPADGALFVATNNAGAGKLYTVNRSSGVATQLCTLAADSADLTSPYSGLAGTHFGVDFNPSADRLRIVDNLGQNLRVNPVPDVSNNCPVTTDGALNIAAVPQSGVTAAAYTNSLGGGSGGGATALDTTLYYVSSLLDQLYSTSNPNNGDLTPASGPLGQNVGAVNGFDIDGRTGAALLAATVEGGTPSPSTSSSLFTVNLTTGAATKSPGAIAGAATFSGVDPTSLIRGLTFTVPPAVATVFGVTADGRLVSFAPATPATLLTNATLSGVDGTTIVGIDFRPATGDLVALTSANQLYSINTTTAAATSVGTLSGATLSGTAFGVDFNPVADRLRVVSDAEQNLRIHPATAVVTTDSPLTAGEIFGAAYINNFVNPSSTALYALDSGGTDSLKLVGANPATGGSCAGTPDAGNPDCGVVTNVGALGVDVTSVGAFDIAGGHNGFALAAMQPGAATESTLYRITLSTGAATAIGVINTTPDSLITALAIRLN